MYSRKRFLKTSLFAGLTPFLPKPSIRPEKPIVISTWNHGLAANKAAWEILGNGGKAIDAVEAGVRVTEADPKVSSVGYGGWPDRDGNVTLDACIMDETGNAGSVAFLQNIMHPISVARKVMDETPHVMLVGKGAQQFAIEKGFKEENLLTDGAKKAWENWLVKAEYKPVINIENHDTIGMLALDNNGDVAGACTTSGAAFKMHGRVGDSPLIGAGLYVDNEIGGAVATGLGEEIIKISGAHLIVELMRQGRTPDEACKEAVERNARKYRGTDIPQVAFLALNKEGVYGSYCMHKGFNFAFKFQLGEGLTDVTSWI